MDVWFLYIGLPLHPLMKSSMNIMSVPGIMVCSSLLINECMVIVWKYFLISSATVIWLSPLIRCFNVCSAVTV